MEPSVMPLMSCWTKTSMRPPRLVGFPSRFRPLTPSLNRGFRRHQRCGTAYQSAAGALDIRCLAAIVVTPMTLSDLSPELVIRLGAFAGVFALMTLWELAAPRRKLSIGRGRRWPNNLGIVIVDVVLVRLLIPTAAVGVALIASGYGFGLLNLTQWPLTLEALLGFLILDLVIWGQHVAFHKVPWLWRLHRMHHADLDIDVTTGLRFHPIEILISVLIKMATVALFGIPPAAVVMFEVVLNATSMFNHTNAR